MKNKHLWKPSKFIMTADGCKISRVPHEVEIGSRFIGDLIAEAYEKVIPQHTQGLLLDLGCGKVPLYEMYKNYVSDNICVDWENTLHKSPYLDYEFDLNQGIPLASEQFETLALILVTDILIKRKIIFLKL